MSRILSLCLIMSLASLGACWRGMPAPAATAAGGDAAADTAASAVTDPGPQPVALTPELVFETISTSYLGHLRRCYTARLKRDGGARGRVVVTFTVDGKGRLSERSASGVGKQLESCVERAMTRWEFPPARAADGSPTEATFRLALQLTSV